MSLKNKLDQGDFIILAEIEPPKGVDVTTMMTNISKIRESVNAFVVTDMANAVLRMSALGAATIIQTKGIETVMQINCRDRNRLALQADLLSAYACGITNIMAVHCEDPIFGDHPQTRVAKDIDLLEFLDVTQGLQKGRDMAGFELTGFPNFLVGSTIQAAVVEETGVEIQKEIERGVEFFIVPPVFDIASIEPFMKLVRNTKAKIIPTVLLLKSVGMARYISLHQKNISIPTALIDRIQNASDTVNECIRCAAEIVSALKAEGVSGVLLSTLGWEDKLPGILDII